MFLVVLIVIVGAILYLKLKSDPQWLKELYKGKNSEQKAVIRYFVREGCLAGTMSDQQYDEIVHQKASVYDFKKRALDKHGLDESQVQEIPPVQFEGYDFNDAYAKQGKDGEWRSSKYQITWIFFSDTQVYYYQYAFNTDDAGKREITDDYWYKDIVNFSSGSETIEYDKYDQKTGKKLVGTVNTYQFQLVVPGDKKYAAIKMNDEIEKIIKGMKNKLREKKS